MRPAAACLQDFQTVEMQESRLILVQAVASRESGRSTCRLRSSRPVHCVHHLQIHAPSLHLPAVCCKPLQSPCNSPAVYALPLDVVTDAPVAAFGCAEPSSTGVVRCLRRCLRPPLHPSTSQSHAIVTEGKSKDPSPFVQKPAQGIAI